MASKKAVEQEQDLVGMAGVRKLTGGLSAVSIWRSYTGRRGDKTPFPAPAGYIMGRRVWRRAEVVAWVQAALTKAPPATATNLGATAP